jgi:tRNA-splicing ligase RtcB
VSRDSHLPGLLSGGDCHYVIPREGPMLVPGRIFGHPDILREQLGSKALQQVKNVACLPGIIEASMAMPDIHEGYGFPIGGVAAMDFSRGVITPGGIGYDINCGVRIMVTQLNREEIDGKIEALVDSLFRRIPAGVGREGPIKLNRRQIDEVFTKGAAWAVEQGYGYQEDLLRCEENGAIEGADPSAVSERAFQRGRGELGTLGSGNHFVEVGYVERIYDQPAASAYGLWPDQVVIWVHSGSRGLGHQVCSDYIGVMRRAAQKYGTVQPDRQLDSAPITSPEGQKYYSAMAAASNYAWANRQILSHYAREAVGEVLGKRACRLGLNLIYDVAHNIGKIEEHTIDGVRRRVLVHRKGATRAFGPGSMGIPDEYRAVGQPVLVPGDMGRASWVLAGTESPSALSFCSACHGAGRAMSRRSAKQTVSVDALKRNLLSMGVVVRSTTVKGLVEEAPSAYKDVDYVVDSTVRAGLGRKVARLRPLGVIKG